jgi:hypothetical protein
MKHGPINVKSPNNTSKWQMGFISAFKGLINLFILKTEYSYISVIILPVICYRKEGKVIKTDVCSDTGAV